MDHKLWSSYCVVCHIDFDVQLLLCEVTLLCVCECICLLAVLSQTALERQDLSRTYLAHHELESVNIISIIYY